MSSRECLQRFSPNLFWDANPSELKMDESRGYIIQRVLEYGQMNDWKLINLYYGLDLIDNTLINIIADPEASGWMV